MIRLDLNDKNVKYGENNPDFKFTYLDFGDRYVSYHDIDLKEESSYDIDLAKVINFNIGDLTVNNIHDSFFSYYDYDKNKYKNFIDELDNEINGLYLCYDVFPYYTVNDDFKITGIFYFIANEREVIDIRFIPFDFNLFSIESDIKTIIDRLAEVYFSVTICCHYDSLHYKLFQKLFSEACVDIKENNIIYFIKGVGMSKMLDELMKLIDKSEKRFCSEEFKQLSFDEFSTTVKKNDILWDRLNTPALTLSKRYKYLLGYEDNSYNDDTTLLQAIEDTYRDFNRDCVFISDIGEADYTGIFAYTVVDNKVVEIKMFSFYAGAKDIEGKRKHDIFKQDMDIKVENLNKDYESVTWIARSDNPVNFEYRKAIKFLGGSYSKIDMDGKVYVEYTTDKTV